MTDEMLVEAVARALCAEGGYSASAIWGFADEGRPMSMDTREKYRSMARAALAALPPEMRAAGEMKRALAEYLAADDALTAFVLAADPKDLGEIEWKRQHRERCDRKRKATAEARAALALASSPGQQSTKEQA